MIYDMNKDQSFFNKDWEKTIVDEIMDGSGVVILNNFVQSLGQDDNLWLLQGQFKDKMSSVADTKSYKFGKAYRCMQDEVPIDYPQIRHVFYNGIIEQIACSYFGYNHYKDFFRELFWCHEFRNNLGVETNGHLHFDKIPTLKFFLYVNDVNESNGPFRFCKNTRYLGEELRKKAWSRTNVYANIKNKLEIDYPEMGYTAEKAEPIIGMAGTLFIFDSDTFHCGGMLNSDLDERKVLRLHVRKTRNG